MSDECNNQDGCEVKPFQLKKRPQALRDDAARALLSIAEQATVFTIEDGDLEIEWLKEGVFSGIARIPFHGQKEENRNNQIVAVWAEMQK